MGARAVKIADKTSPVAKGLDVFELKYEIYSNTYIKLHVKPLATIDHRGTTWPVVWTCEYGKGRAFHTTLDHKNWKPGTDDPLHDPNLTKLIIQGTDRVAGLFRRANVR